MNEQKELINLREIAEKAVNVEDGDTANVFFNYIDSYCTIKHNSIEKRFDKIERMIEDLGNTVNSMFDNLKKELGLNGYSGRAKRKD